MNERNIILTELQGLSSILVGHKQEQVYKVPEGYFENLPGRILSRIKAGEMNGVSEELFSVSPLIHGIPKNLPYSVPENYFEGLHDKIMTAIRNHPDYQTAGEELDSLSPILAGLGKKTPYAVPDGYFDTLTREKKENRPAKVVSFRKKWMRMAAAAVLIGVVVIGGLLFFNQKKIDPVKNPDGWIARNVSKKVSTEKLDEFIELAGTGNITSAPDENNAKGTEEVRELIKDIPVSDIDELLNDAVAFQSYSIPDEELINME